MCLKRRKSLTNAAHALEHGVAGHAAQGRAHRRMRRGVTAIRANLHNKLGRHSPWANASSRGANRIDVGANHGCNWALMAAACGHEDRVPACQPSTLSGYLARHVPLNNN